MSAAEYRSPYLPEMCTEEGHIDGCAGRAGGDHEFVLPLNAMRCTTCGHRLDSMGGCDGCIADVEALMWEARTDG